jgi:hypothetical protein
MLQVKVFFDLKLGRRILILHKRILSCRPPANKRLERTRHERASLVSCVGKPLKRSVMPLNAQRENEAQYVG